MKNIFICLLSCLFLANNSLAVSGMCPFKATDSNVISLSQETASALQGLLDKKNECNDSVKAAVDSAKGLPDLIRQAQDPASSLLAEEQWVNEEIAKAISDQAYASTPDPTTGQTYIETLMERKTKLPREISRLRIARNYEDKELAKTQALSMAQNIISNLSNTMASGNSKCSQAITGSGIGTRLLTMGLGLVASLSPLFMAGQATAASLSASLLNDFVNMFSRMPPDALQRFDSVNQTVDLACLYYQVTMSHCSMVERTENVDQMKEAKRNLSKAALCLPNHGLYGQILNLKDLSAELQEVASSIARNAPLGGNDGANSALNREITDLFFKDSSGTRTDIDEIKEQNAKYRFLSKFYGPGATLSINSLPLNDRSNLKIALDTFIMNISNRVQNVGLTFKRSEGQTQYTSAEMFITNNSSINEYLNAKSKELNVGSDSNISSINDAKRLHELINKDDFKKKLQYAKSSYNALKEYASTNKDKSNTSDLSQLANQSDRSLELITTLENWSNIDPLNRIVVSAEHKAWWLIC